jgi:dolichyl-phosphate-mannose-protein mannosyltransferase
MKRPFSPELLVLTALSALTHFWKLFTPNVVVFDEVHYKHFAGTYLAGTRYFDVHPPLANLLYAAVARVFGISATTLLGNAPAVQLRLLPALLGTFVVPLVYVILRQLGAARRVATLGAFAVLCENALLLDSRLILIEPLLICVGLVAVTLYLAARERSGASRWFLLGTSAFFAGCALSAKWTGASALGLIMVAWFVEQPRTRATLRRTLAEGALFIAIAASVYIATFAIHFHLGPQSDPAASIPLVSRMAQLHGRMVAGNRNLEAVIHPGASPWYTWPIMKHPIAL